MTNREMEERIENLECFIYYLLNSVFTHTKRYYMIDKKQLNIFYRDMEERLSSKFNFLNVDNIPKDKMKLFKDSPLLENLK